jgi:alpha-L-rhamnosidase
MHGGIPSDCPHREKLPYTGDGSLCIESSLYVFDSVQFYYKWLDDIIEAQGNNGWVPYSAPNIGGAGGYWWSNALTNVAVKLYSFTGDKSVLERALEPSIKYLKYCESVHNGTYLLDRSFIRWYLGEWLNPTETKIDVVYMNSLAYYSAVTDVLFMCERLNLKEKASQMVELQNKIKTAINEKYYSEKNAHYDLGVQGESLLPVVWDFLEGEQKDRVWEKLVGGYKATGVLDTGIILTPQLIDALTVNGEQELAYKLFTTKERPSFYKMLEGETTLVESWNKVWPTFN